MSKDGPILVIGGTGHYGGFIVRALLEQGAWVRVLSRNAERARTTLGEGPEIAEGDITDPAALAEAMQGARAIVIAIAANKPGQIRQRQSIERDAVLSLLKEAERQDLRRIVYLSGYDIQRDFAMQHGLLDFAEPQLAVQAALEASKLEWTILGCPPSMEIFFAFIRGQTMRVPGGGPPALPTIAPSDLGIIAAQAALRDDLARLHFRLPGPEALSFPEAARRIGEVWGQPLRFGKIPLAPIKSAAFLFAWAFPYLGYLGAAVTLLNAFPEAMAAEVPKDHQRVKDTFDFTPTSLEDEARRRRP